MEFNFLNIFILLNILVTVHCDWGTSEMKISTGHYPMHLCHFTNTIFNPKDSTFYYNNNEKLHPKCQSGIRMWNIDSTNSLSESECAESYDRGYVFTIYYYHGSSNYYHLHYDMLIPLYKHVYHDKMTKVDSVEKLLFMPSVETIRLQKVTFGTPAFKDPNKYWVQTVKLISHNHTMKPLDSALLEKKEKICFNNVYFGTPSVKYDDDCLIKGFVSHVKQAFGVGEFHLEKHRVGIINRQGRRALIKGEELVEALNKIVDTDLIEFSGMSFSQQVSEIQKYTVLAGLNGAGLMNCLYLPPGGVCIQLVPYNSSLNVEQYGILLKSRGPYMVWRNTHENLHFPSGQSKANVNNQAGTEVHIEEFTKVINEALTKAKGALLPGSRPVQTTQAPHTTKEGPTEALVSENTDIKDEL